MSMSKNNLKSKSYDLIILGAGPAGLTAAIYAARYRLDFIIIGRVVGGYMTESHQVENFPGMGKVSGMALSQKIANQLKALGHEPITDDIQAIKKTDDLFCLYGTARDYKTKRLILALGTERKQLNIPGEKEFLGRGVSYCATCDGPFFKGRTVAVVGGGDTAVSAALYLADITNKVYLVVRKDKLAAEPSWQEKIKAHKKIDIISATEVKEIQGAEKVEKIILNGSRKALAVAGVFIEIGQTPSSALLESIGIKRDKKDYIVVDATQKTSVSGVWAAGDATTGSNKLKQIVTACAEGAVAAADIFQEIKKSK